MIDLAKGREAAIAPGNAAAFEDVIDCDALTKVVTSGIAAAPAVREGFIAGVKERRRAAAQAMTARALRGGLLRRREVGDEVG